jgi:hypothetical protein
MTRIFTLFSRAGALCACLALTMIAPAAHAFDVGGLKCETADADFEEAQRMRAAGLPLVGYRFEQAQARMLMDAMSTSEAGAQPGDPGAITIHTSDVGVILALGYGTREDALIRFYDASGCLMVAGTWPWNDLVTAMLETGLAW